MTTLAEELKSKKLDISEHQEAFLSLLVTAQRLAAAHAHAFASLNISAKQYNILRILRAAGDDGLPVMEIGRRMVERAPDVSRIIDRMVDAGHVLRRRQKADRRIVVVKIATEGLRLLEELTIPIESDTTKILSGLSIEDAATLNRLLEGVRASIYSNSEAHHNC